MAAPDAYRHTPPVDGPLRLIASWLITGRLSVRWGLPPVASIIPGIAIPGSSADLLSFHDNWLVCAFVVVPDNPTNDELQAAIDRLSTFDAPSRQRLDARLNHWTLRVVVTAGDPAPEHGAFCLEQDVSYIAAACGADRAASLPWMM